MNLKSRHKVDPSFNMSSMTDMVFLLLIFFILTSGVVESGLPVNLPSSKKSPIIPQTVSVTITKDMQYQIGDKLVTLETLEEELRKVLPETEGVENVVAIRGDKDIKYNDVMEVAAIAANLKAKVSLSTSQK